MVLVNLVDLLATENTGRVEVALRHHDVAVGLHDVERAVLNELNHLFPKVRLHRLEVAPLVVVQVLLNHTGKGRRELVVGPFRGVRSVAFGQLPDEHRRQIVLVSGEQHVTRGWDTGLEVVRNRGVLTGAEGLETVVPPRDKGWFF